MLGDLEPFKLERFFAKWEYTAPHLLCCSDSQPLTVQQVLEYADQDLRERFDTLSLAYTESQGLPELRQEVARLYRGMTADDVVVLAPEEGILLALTALTQPGDHVVVTYPGYQSLYEVARSRGCTLSYWEPRLAPRKGEGGGAGGGQAGDDSGAPAPHQPSFHISDLQKLIRPGSTKLVVANFPHNPTGASLTPEQWQQLVDVVQGAGARLFSDEMYRFLPQGDAPETPSACELWPQGAVCLCGMSKCFGMPGIRVGWLITKDQDLLQKVLALKDYTTICSSAPSELLALIGLRAAPAILARQRALLSSNLDALDEFFSRHADTFEWARPQYGTVAFPRIKTGEPIKAFCERVVDGCGVLLLPGSVYDHPPSEEQGRVRVGFGRQDLPACLEVLDKWLLQQQ